MDKEELADCDYCLRTGRRKNLARLIVGYDVHMGRNVERFYCPQCLRIVEAEIKELPWVQEYGYTVDYPFKK
ncbi:hypothetical protein ACFFJY_08135 [Fictibacillus aquaticus]|uniref:Uncharacterized protein n=1 Tax=Fictibacillus aquaticus TaxID=2021314 RepID=A0A235F9A5_9BACL|nr:hypothetical protein [Fictibacillus aquaticus]OYD57858.1 hypothetical protein CGZ90_08120 [Fictibacillus aquaticus]